MSEKWKESGLAPGYEISNLGRVRMKSRHVINRGRRHFRGAKMLKQYESEDKYLFVSIFPKGLKTASGTAVNKKYFVHRLVMDAFVSSCPDDMTVDHINRDRQDNTLENLRYATKAEQDANRDLARISGENSRFAKLNWEKVRKIRNLHKLGETIKELSIDFGVSEGTIQRVVSSKSWKSD